jgi:hypothetical protein
MVGGIMAKARLSPDPQKLHSIVYYDNGKLYWKKRGNPRFDNAWANKEAGCYKYPSGYGTISYDGGHLMIHRAVWILHHGAIPCDQEIDHINGVKADNRIGNLRICSKGQNICNSKLRLDNSTGVKGVHKTEDGRYWRVRVQFNGKRHELGVYKSLEDAELVARTARDAQHGDFANHGKHSKGLNHAY